MSASDLPSSGDREAARFRAILRPHRSLSRAGFVAMMTGVGLVGFVTGVAFLAIGAWPVFGFFGLDVALIWLAFHLNYRSGRRYETIEIFERELVVTHVEPSGRTWRRTFNPYWARVAVKTWPNGSTDLRLASHGELLSFGRFLTDDERRDFADALDLALAKARAGG